MDLLLNIDPVTSQHNLKGLWHLYDTVESQVRSLKALGVSADSYGSILSSVFVNKLPEELRLIVSRHVREDEWTLDAIMNVTEGEIIARERAHGNSCRGPKQTMRDPLTASSLLTSGSGAPKCSYCHQPHTSSTCRTVTNVSERKQILRKTGRCCPGIENPVDIPSRGITPTELASCKLWRYGPDWLVERNPALEEGNYGMPEECLKEMKSTHCYVTHTSQTTLDLDKIICCKNFSCLQRLLRVTGYVLRFMERCKSRTRASEMIETELAAADVAKAETLWVKELQRELPKHKDFLNWKRQFDLFLEGEVWRCKGRLGNSDIPYSTKYPILLTKSHHLTVLIVQAAHKRVMHNGVKETLTEIRSKYLIIKGRQFMRQVIH